MRYSIGSAFVCGAGGSEPLLSTRTVRRLKAGARVTFTFGPDARPAAHVTCDRGARLLRGGAQTCCTPFSRGGRTGGALNVAPKPGGPGRPCRGRAIYPALPARYAGWAAGCWRGAAASDRERPSEFRLRGSVWPFLPRTKNGQYSPRRFGGAVRRGRAQCPASASER